MMTSVGLQATAQHGGGVAGMTDRKESRNRMAGLLLTVSMKCCKHN